MTVAAVVFGFRDGKISRARERSSVLRNKDRVVEQMDVASND